MMDPIPVPIRDRQRQSTSLQAIDRKMDLSHIKPTYTTPNTHADTSTIQTTLTTLSLHPHPEGGFFAEADRNPLRIPNPHLHSSSSDDNDNDDNDDNDTRSASSSILYYLTPRSPLGAFHRNASRTVHTLHRGRGRYVILHADAETRAKHGGKAAVETFVVGGDITRGERLQWVVEGGRYKASFLLSDDDGDGGGLVSDGLLISEIVIPGFEYKDHDFLRAEEMDELLTPQQARELNWLLRETG